MKMNHTFGTTLKNVAKKSFKNINENIEIPKQYIEALYLTQFFEILLESLYSSLIIKGQKYFRNVGLDYQPEKRRNWGISDYLNRIKTFFPPDEYKSSFEKLKKAGEKRNAFIHECFKTKDGEIQQINLDKEKIHLNSNAIKKVEDWRKAYNIAFPIILNIMLKVRKTE